MWLLATILDTAGLTYTTRRLCPPTFPLWDSSFHMIEIKLKKYRVALLDKGSHTEPPAVKDMY